MDSEEKLKSVESPNPDASIGFVTFYPFQFYALKNIYAQVQNEAEFIVHSSPREKISGRGLAASVKILQKNGANFRTLDEEKHFSDESLKKFFSRYRALVGLTFGYCCVNPARNNLPKIWVEYGAGKDLWKFHPIKSKLDLLLLYGERSASLFKFYANLTVVGNTRFDDWFNNTLDQGFMNEIKTKLDPSKKTIFYLPTHGELSALDMLLGPLERVRKKFNIIIKLHHRTVCDAPEKITLLREKGFLVFDDTVDSLPLYKIADVALGDNSSALFEALLAQKPLVAADFFSRDFLEEHSLRFRRHHDKIIIPQTYAESLEQQLKARAAFCAKTPEELEDTIESALKSPRQFREDSQSLVRKIFAFNDGRCSLRAGAAIENFLLQKELPPKPILYFVFDAFSKETEINTLDTVSKLPLWRKLKFILQNFFFKP